jgi:hypothetical protein
MDPSRTCPSCAAPAQPRQRWCLECGAELPQGRRGALRPVVGIATTLAVLVGAASAGGYTILRHDRQPPPAASTVAQAPASPATGAAPATGAPASGLPATGGTSLGSPGSSLGSTYNSTTLPSVPAYKGPTGSSAYKYGTGGSGGASTHRTATTHRHRASGGTTHGGTPSGNGSVSESNQTSHATTTPKSQLALTNVALGAAAVAYAPYASAATDLGDPSRVTDGTTRTAWRTPAFGDPATHPQLGLYVDLATAQKLRRLVIETPTPGMAIEVYATRQDPPETITDPGWTHVATRPDLAAKASIALHDHAFRYVLVWIVGLAPGAHRAAISELSLLSLQPE